eukprot:comp24173_c0_seq6/m.44187 comp24173_c0_seq6/g.44187  ORF comp24173_c0_seq6/g.44187 comp24173_c0_seq6/m.44187 type:complete len:1717 (-) comp24173_c0_seq6:350-5500(-)
MASQHMFLVRGLQKILDEKEIKRHTQARKECQKVLDEIKAEVTKAEANGGDVSDGIVDADKYFHAFQLACATKNPKIQCVALDAIQKLLAYGYLHGAGPDPNDPSQWLIDAIIDAICGCFVGDFTDQTVALQIIKALLTAVTASASAVHEGALLRAVRTCYNIHLASPSLVIQTTAKATLTQMLNVIFSRMEAQAAVIESEAQESPDAEGMALSETDTASQSASAEEQPQVESVAANGTESGEVAKTENGDGNPAEVHEVPTTLVTPPSTQSVKDEPAKANADSALGPPSSLGESPQIGGSNVSVASIDSTGRRLSLESATRVSMDGNGTDPHVKAKFSHILQLDAYLVFRSLCKLSMKDLPPTTGPIDIKSHEMRSKVLSLELLLVILQNSGPCFQNHEQFIGAVKQYLCISLSKNGVSSVPQIFELSLAIFLCLLASFKFHLKAQIEVFFKDIFLPILETSASSFQHKWMVLQALSRIFGDPQTIIDIYLNYDCDLTLDNIFNHMIEDISKIAQGRAGHELGLSEQQEQHVGQMRRLGLECLVTCLAAMVEWINARDRDRERQNEDMVRSSTLNTEDNAGNPDERDPGTPDGGTTNASTASLPWVDNPQDFEVKKKHKEVVEEALSRFNEKPKKGLRFAQDKGLCGKSPTEVAEWFQKEDRLSKTAIGEFLGENDDYCKAVMYAYVDAMDFANHPFVDALRLFLEGFRLPGEAQKIDRLMEKFAARYCETNPKNEAFENADTAYVLAYSIIMLTTDLHSTNVHKKMTIDEFVRNNRGINDGKDLPREFLVAIYEDIQANEIRVKEDRAQKKTTYAPAQLLNEKTRKALYRAEMETRLQSAQAVLTDKARASAHFIVGSHVAHVKPMFAACWTSCLAVFSLHFKDSTDMHTVRTCLEGLRHGIKISSTFFMDTERESFVLALTKFTTLLTPHPVLNSKTMECMKVLLACAGDDGNNLQKSWYQVLKCVSNLDLLINFGSGDDAALLGNDTGMNESDMDQRKGLAETQSFISSMKIPTSSAGPSRGSLSGSSLTVTTAGYGLREEKAEDGMPSQTTTQGLAVACDRVFGGSVGLGGEAIVEFVRWLCVVSVEELQAGRPRMYSLSKIVEVAYYNMNRIRLEWSKVWAVLGEHFNKVGCMASLTISMFAVDSLRQLSMKFLERGELAHFHFQKDFLKPFEYIMNHNKNTDIRDMVVRCLANMVQGQAQHIRSGWKNIFFVFSLAALDPHSATVHLAFSTTSKIFTEHGTLFVDTAFVDGVNCLVEFACNRSVMGLSMEALDLLQRCAVPMVPGLVQYPADHVYNDDDRVWVQGWFPILFGLHRIMTRCPLEVRTRALTVLIEIINHHGSEFRPQHWKDLFRIMFRIFDDLKLPEHQAEKTEWINTTCHHALFAVLDIFGNYFDQLAGILLEDLLDRILWCTTQGSEQLARSATQGIQVLLANNGDRFTPAMWDVCVRGIQTMFDSSTPTELFEFDSAAGLESDKPPGQKFNFHRVMIKCVVQLELIQAVQNVVLLEKPAFGTPPADAVRRPSQPNAEPEGLFPSITMAHLTTILECLKKSNELAAQFNANYELRTAVWKAGFMKQLPNLYKQETSSLQVSLGLLCRMYDDSRYSPDWDHIGSRLMHAGKNILHIYVTPGDDRQRDIWAPILAYFLSKVLAFGHERFALHVAEYYDSLVDMLALEMGSDLRSVLRGIFRRVGDEYLKASLKPTVAAAV